LLSRFGIAHPRSNMKMDFFDQPQYLEPAHRGCDGDLLKNSDTISGEPTTDSVVLDTFYVFFIASMRLGRILGQQKDRLSSTIHSEGEGFSRKSPIFCFQKALG
jgi:hypothetical protein